MAKRYYWLLITVFFICGCANVRHAVPEESLNNVRIFGMQDIRAFSGSPSDSFKKDFIQLLEQEKKYGFPLFDFKASRTYPVLAISGGAANGAYGAGLLNGWSKSGTRPVFKIVTGISTGAIIAPFAFLGSQYDDKLKEFYLKYSTKDVVRIRIPFINSFASTQPLERLIEHYFDAELLKGVALEYSKGRRLYVGTTNLDAQRLVLWDMGKIASVGNDKALELFRKIILASASVPIAFPPVYLNVEVNNKQYDEMHVDGGVTKQVFFLYDVLKGFDRAIKEQGLDISRNKYAIYVIRNGYVDPLYKEIPDKLSAIAERTVNTMTNAQSIGDLYQLYVFTKDGKGDFNLAYIPATHISKAREFFDPLEMQELFNLGYQEASQGYPWKKLPPGLRGINEPQKFNDPSEVIKVVVGERFLITLESNKTTGYEWQLVNPLDSNALQIVSSGYIPGDSKLMGAAGKEEWSFLALKPVKANIYFKYVRSWEKGIAPAKEATFTVLIDK